MTLVTDEPDRPAYRGGMRRAAVLAFVALSLSVAPPIARAAGDWVWPVVGPIVRGFDPPTSPFGSGHRGIDIAAAPATVLVAPEAGQVTFAGPVGGELFVTIDHGDGVRSTMSWLSAILVRRNDLVERGQPVAVSGHGHTALDTPHVHFGVRLGETYVDPLDYLGPIEVSRFVRLAPWVEAA